MTPQLLKAAVTKEVTQLMAPILAEFKSTPDWQEVTKNAYPPPPSKVIVKKAKKLGTRFPGVKKDAADGPDLSTNEALGEASKGV